MLLLLAAAPAPFSRAGDLLARRGVVGASVDPPAEGRAGVRVREVPADGAAARAGLRAGDVITHVDGRALDGAAAWGAARAALRAGQPVALTLARGTRQVEARLTPDPLPYESHECCEARYDSVADARGQQVRTIVTRPRGATGRLPAVLFVGWLSCDTVELPAEGGDGWARMLRKLVRESGYVVMRVDKPGVGDSQGDCAQTDFTTELSAYRAALQALARHEWVDPEALLLFGGSFGGATAPLLAQQTKVRGVAVWGTFAKTWLEHMIELERRRLTLSGKSPAAVSDKMRGYVELHALILNGRRTPGDVVRERPDLAPLWYDEPDALYGRPIAFFHQAQELNLAGAWDKIDAPVLSLHGEYDWIMSRDDHALVADIVEARRPGLARFVDVPRLDHHFTAYDSARKAFAEEGGSVNLEPLDLLLAWMKDVLAGRIGAPSTGAAGAGFEARVRPLLAQRCAPCHVPGGRMYARLPFDDAEVVRSHRAGILRRLDGDDRTTVEAWLDAPGQ
jgi:pimeloyl-ACP methyl ester carboxylesterase